MSRLHAATGVAASAALLLPASSVAAPPATRQTPPTVQTTPTAQTAPASTSSPAVPSVQTGRHARGTPLVIAHRGASGYRPEHTLSAYELAVGMGADYIEPDLVMTRDRVLVDRHEPEISGTTDVADHPEFADRRTTKEVDGTPVTGWFVEDFTLRELRTLRAKERLGAVREESAMYDGRFPVPTFEEVLRTRAELSRRTGRQIGIIPEIKHSTYLHDRGFDPERELVRLARRYGLNSPRAPFVVQSFELTNLRELRTDHGYRGRSVFLTGASGGPYDLRAQGTTYAELLAPASLRRLSRFVDGLGPEKGQVIPRRADGTLGTPTSLVRDAHRAGLTVTPYTFRAENQFLPVDYRVGSDPTAFGRAIDEAKVYLQADVDGIFCDQPDVCLQARSELGGRRAG